MIPIFDAEATRAALPFPALIEDLRRMFADGCEVPARQVLLLGTPGGPEVASLIMPAWQRAATPGAARRCYGVKTVNVASGNAARGLPGLFATYVLYDADSGEPLAMIDGNEITARRTAAASALAASMLAREDAARLLVVGAGRVSGLMPAAYRAVRPIGPVRVWARRADSARALAAQWRAEGFDASAAEDLAAAAAQADIVTCATMATEPLLRGAWLRPGSHLDLVGGFAPHMREADDDCFARAGVYVDTGEALRKAGDLLGPMSRGVLGEGDIRGTLEDLCRDPARGRRGPAERTVFKSVGTALEDLAAAMRVAGRLTAPS